MADDEVRLSASLDDDLSAALARIEKRLNDVERKIAEVGTAGTAAGKDLDELGEKAEEASEKVKGLGDETEKTDEKTRKARVNLDGLSKGFDKAGKKAGSFGSILQAYKMAGMVTGAFALAGGISAIGAGAGIAIGGLAPMVGMLAALGPLMLAAKLSTMAFKLAATQLQGPMGRIKQQFTELGDQIAGGGLLSGMNYLADSMRGLARASGKGLSGLGAEIGAAAQATGDWIASEPFLTQVSIIFAGLRPIVASATGALLSLGEAFLDIVQGSLPMTQELMATVRAIAGDFAAWTQAQLDSGRMTAWLINSWNIFRRTVGVVVDVLIGLFNIFKIGGKFAGEFGAGIEDAAYKFRLWTTSAEGQARITQYFQDSLPALREMGKLLAMVAGGFGSLAANQNVAPLLQQIREELAPAVGVLVNNLAGQGGLGPALIDVATALVTLFANLDFSALTLFAQAIAGVLNGIIWLTQNVPGASIVVSGLFGALLAFKLLGPVFGAVSSGISAFAWMQTAMGDTKNLTLQQSLFAKAMRGLGSVFSTVGKGIIFVIRAIGAAMMSNPIIAAIMIIIGVLLYLWFNCEWFRDGVMAIWQVIADAAVVAWEWISNAFTVAVDAIVGAAMWLWENGIRPVWELISEGAKLYWSFVVAYVTTVVDVITAIVKWIYDAAMWVWSGIATAAEYWWGFVKFYIQTVIFIIMAIIAGLAWAAEKVWQGIVTIAQWAWGLVAAGAVWLWENGIKPVLDFIIGGWTWLTATVEYWWNWLVLVLGVAWNLFYTTYIQPVINAVSAAWQWLVNGLAAAWQWLNETIIQPAIQWIQERWQYWTTVAQLAMQILGDAIGGIWQWIKDVFAGAIDWISQRWSDFTTWISDAFRPVGEAIGGLWTRIQDAASRAADVVRGAWDAVVGAVKGAWNWIARGWNSIPSVSVPDWVPGIGGTSWSLPKLPTLWHGGETPGGPALVGEHGPEPLVRNGLVDWVGLNGPEVMNLPKGGYVVPNLNTLAAMPGLARSIPSSVAAAVARSVPAYSGAGRGDGGLLGAVGELTEAVRSQRPPISVGSEDAGAAVLAALRQHDREREARGRYSYTAGKG